MRHVRKIKKAGTLATGVHGRIVLRRYFPAANVQGFIVERDEREQLWLRAYVANGDDYKLSQTPLEFIVTLRRGSWVWPIVEILSYRDHAFTARLGAAIAKQREESDVLTIC